MLTLIAACFNPVLSAKHRQMINARKPLKIAIAAIMQKLVMTANTLG
ncbi:hypothetical protein [Caenibius tardaugens]|nr:hypothetical protein [Caenibius tardaugens]